MLGKLSACSRLNGKLIVRPTYKSAVKVLNDGTGSQFDKIYTVPSDGWFTANLYSSNGYGWGHAYVNGIAVASFRANPIDVQNYVQFKTIFFAPKDSVIRILGDNGMCVQIDRID